MKKSQSESLKNIRHSLAHLLAAAVMELWPDAKRTIGPVIENGFYYDFDFPVPVTNSDLPKIEKKMREILKTWDKFEKISETKDSAESRYADNEYKKELIREITDKGEEITSYKSGNFTDLCRGGHMESAKSIDPQSFKLTRAAGAYWRGDEKNKMLTRVYGLAFGAKKELDEYLAQIAEAEKRDHKKLGPELDLFTFSDMVGAGLPLWTPKGTVLRNTLDDFIWQLRQKHGYQKVEIPHITKKDLYEKSGHWDKFKDELFRITTREGHEFAMKPMNCPHHTQIYARRLWSYRELPQRYANTTMCYRDEQTGELSGISRTRAFTQDDAHVFCRMEQAKEEFTKVWDMVHEFYSSFGFALRVRLSLHDPKHLEKYLGDKAKWSVAEKILREIIDSKNTDWFEGAGEAAFYGPKLDFMAKDAFGREWQVATIQLDMNMPERFDLTCVNEKGEKERIIMIHAAIMGSVERFLSVLIEHTAGVFPAWLAPIQITLLPVSAEKHLEYARKLAMEFEEKGARVWVDDTSESVGKKIRNAERQKIPFMLVIGDKEIGGKKLSVRIRGQKDVVEMDMGELLVERLKR